MSQPLLYDLYQTLRDDKQWLAPGLDEYYLLFELMRSDYPIDSFRDIAFALETIWVKNPAQKENFRQLMEQRRIEIEGWAAYLKKEQEQPDTSIKPETAPVLPALADTQNGTPDVKNGVEPDAVNVTDKKEGVTETSSKEIVQPDAVAEEYGDTQFTIGIDEKGKQAMLIFDKPTTDTPLNEMPFLFTNDYFPVSSRQLQQAWRTLRNKQEGNKNNMPDIGKTIKATAERGYFTWFEFERDILNDLELFIFIDQRESMVAEEAFGIELSITAKLSDLHTEAKPWYFYKAPQKTAEIDDYILASEEGTRAVTLNELFARLDKKNILVLIYSDAGCLEKDDDDERLARLRAFINHLYNRVAYLAWLNPAPAARWANTNAAYLLEDVPMFTTGRAGIINSISALRGKAMIK